ncbi:MAG: chorismate synthase, partial [Rhodospirillaceae bacterium]
FSSFGESHGPAIGCVIDGVPPGIPLEEADLQRDLDRRRPGQSKFTTQRQEPDQARILSGVFEGVTTGTPIGVLIENTDQRSRDYSDIAKRYRPGHADYTYDAKYGVRDYRGGGRSSARETAMRVAAGAVAKKILSHCLQSPVLIQGAMIALGKEQIDRSRWDWDQVGQNPFFCPDAASVPVWEQSLARIRKAGSSIGALIEVVAQGIPAGLGEPVYDRLDADLAKAMMSINAVKGVEIGAGFAAAGLTGEENADEMDPDPNSAPNAPPLFRSNNAGGVLGGISTGQDIVVRMAIKPTSSILTPKHSIDSDGQAVSVSTKGRHDPCVGIRAVPVAEAMMACTLADHLLRHRGQTGRL